MTLQCRGPRQPPLVMIGWRGKTGTHTDTRVTVHAHIHTNAYAYGRTQVGTYVHTHTHERARVQTRAHSPHKSTDHTPSRQRPRSFCRKTTWIFSRANSGGAHRQNSDCQTAEDEEENPSAVLRCLSTRANKRQKTENIHHGSDCCSCNAQSTVWFHTKMKVFGS